MARLVVGAAGYALPPGTDIDRLVTAIITAMGEGTGLAVTVEGGDGRPLHLIVNCAVAETVTVDPGGTGDGGDDGAVPKGGRISG